jgi:hypothetical protein
MADFEKNGPALPSSHDLPVETMSVQDAFVVLAVRLIGSTIRNDPSARQHIMALARGTQLFRMENYNETGRRLNRFVIWAGTPAMDDLFARALDILRTRYRAEALRWVAANAVSQQLSDEMTAMLHHIGKALGFTVNEVEAALKRALSQASDGTIPLA